MGRHPACWLGFGDPWNDSLSRQGEYCPSGAAPNWQLRTTAVNMLFVLLPVCFAAELKKEVAEAAARKNEAPTEEKEAAPAELAAEEEMGAPAAEQPPAAVEEQLLQAEPEAAAGPQSQPARRSARGQGGSADSQRQQAAQQEAAPAPASPSVPAAVPRKRRQATIQVVQVGKKQKSGALAKHAAAAGKNAAEPPVGRGLRTSDRVSQRAG